MTNDINLMGEYMEDHCEADNQPRGDYSSHQEEPVQDEYISERPETEHFHPKEEDKSCKDQNEQSENKESHYG